MKLTILNKREVMEYIPKKKAVVIRVGDIYPLNTLNHKYIEESHFYFSDIDEESEYSIQKDEADKLANFILKYIDSVDEFVIHCVYAQGRSPAIALAIATFLEIENNYDKKYPDINRYVFLNLLDAILREA